MFMLVLFCSGLAELQYLGSVPFTAPAYFGQRQHRRTISPTSYPPSEMQFSACHVSYLETTE